MAEESTDLSQYASQEGNSKKANNPTVAKKEFSEEEVKAAKEFLQAQLASQRKMRQEHAALPMETKYQEDKKPEQAKNRAETVRNITIHPSLQAAFSKDDYQKYEKRITVEPSELHPSIARMFDLNPNLKIEAIKNDDGSMENLVISSPVNDHLTSVVVADPKVYTESQIALGGKRAPFDRLAISKALVVNSKGQAINLVDYLPEHPADPGQKEIFFRLDELRESYAISSRAHIVTQPLVDMRGVFTFIHESGHQQAFRVNPYQTKYSVERDASAFVFTAARELQRRGFWNEDDTNRLINMQREKLEGYQYMTEHGERVSVMMDVLAPQEAHTQEAVGLSRRMELDKNKPSEERRTRTPQFEKLLSSLKELSAKLPDECKEIIEKYNLKAKQRSIYEGDYLQVRDKMVRIYDDNGQLKILEFLPGDPDTISTIQMRTYSLTDNGIQIEIRTFSQKLIQEYLPKTETITFDSSQPELGVRQSIFRHAKVTINELFNLAKTNQVVKLPLTGDQLFDRLQQSEPQEFPKAA